MSEKIEVICKKDQRWSFGIFEKGQIIKVKEDIAYKMVKFGYCDYYVSTKSMNPVVENKMILNKSVENKKVRKNKRNKSQGD